MEAELIVSMIYDIYQIVNSRQAKYIWNNIIPRNDDPCLNAKAALINALVGVRLINEDGVFITRNDNFYSGDTINPALFTDDGVHIHEMGISKLANNTRSSICRSLDKEYVAKSKFRN